MKKIISLVLVLMLCTINIVEAKFWNRTTKTIAGILCLGGCVYGLKVAERYENQADHYIYLSNQSYQNSKRYLQYSYYYRYRGDWDTCLDFYRQSETALGLARDHAESAENHAQKAGFYTVGSYGLLGIGFYFFIDSANYTVEVNGIGVKYNVIRW